MFSRFEYVASRKNLLLHYSIERHPGSICQRQSRSSDYRDDMTHQGLPIYSSAEAASVEWLDKCKHSQDSLPTIPKGQLSNSWMTVCAIVRHPEAMRACMQIHLQMKANFGTLPIQQGRRNAEKHKTAFASPRSWGSPLGIESKRCPRTWK